MDSLSARREKSPGLILQEERPRMDFLSISQPSREKTATGWRVSALVAGDSLWFESPDLPLHPSPEAFAAAGIMPAMLAGMDVRIDTSLDDFWCKQVAKAMEIFQDWWGYRPAEILAPRVALSRPSEQRHALLFSGGVDAFYTLLRDQFPVRDLVWIHGFDLPLDRTEPAMAVEERLRRLAAEQGMRLIVVRTNFRRHPLTGRRIRDNQIGLLAAVGHVLPQISHVIVSSTIHRKNDVPHATHWLTDHLWSSARRQFVHFGEDVSRNDKLRAIMDEPLAQNYLRVCIDQGCEKNCGRCEKCLRCMVVLKSLGRLDRFRVFRDTRHLVEDIDALPFFKYADIASHYQEALDRGLAGELKRAVQGLVDRTRISLYFRPLGIRATRAAIQLIMPKPWGRRLGGFFQSWSKKKKPGKI
jgi:hypothetical protein